MLVQKPLALSLADAAATIQIAQAAQRLLFVDYSYRFIPTVRLLKEELSAIGSPKKVSAAFHTVYGPGKAWFFDPRLSGGGALVDLGVHLLDLGLDLFAPRRAVLENVELLAEPGSSVERFASLLLRLDDLPFSLHVSWHTDRAATEVFFEVEGERGRLRWENVEGSFFRFRTWRDDACLMDLETTLREDTLAAFSQALELGSAPGLHLSVYDLLDQAYGPRGAVVVGKSQQTIR